MDAATESLLQAEQHFDRALLAADTRALETILDDQFFLNDFMGGVTRKSDLVGHIQSGVLKFHSIIPNDLSVHIYSGSAVVTGWTEMKAEFQNAVSAVKSRFLHVYVSFDGTWRLVSAQGTIIP